MKPKLLDFCCCEGGASVGYHRAGFDVYGVDLFEKCKQNRYPFPSLKYDAVRVLTRLIIGDKLYFRYKSREPEVLGLSDFAVLAGSPPCQPHSITKYSHNKDHEDILDHLRALFLVSKLPYVIENVPGAPLVDPLILCGTEFNLIARDKDDAILYLRRHRLFESNIKLIGNGGCACDKFRTLGLKAAGVYGGGSESRIHAETVRRGGYTPKLAVRQKLMGIDWMTQAGLSQAIPPAYTEYIGKQLIEELKV